MKLLITGDAGFIGKRLMDRLCREHSTFGLELDDFYDGPAWRDQLLIRLMQLEPDAIFHVGACSDTLEQRVNLMMEINYEATCIISDWCKVRARPLIYSSSAAVYGTNGQYPANLYGWSKRAAESYVTLNGGIALRYFNVYGPGEDHKGRMASVANQAHKKFKAGGEVKLFPGRPTRDFVHVDDVVSANLHALLNYSELKGRAYEVGSGETRSFEEVLDLMSIPYEHTDEAQVPDGYQYHTLSNSQTWMKGWRPEHTLESGVTSYKKWLINES